MSISQVKLLNDYSLKQINEKVLRRICDTTKINGHSDFV